MWRLRHQLEPTRGVHGRVTAQAALVALAAGLERLPQRPAVTLLAVSEFGRRLRENGSGGTDHGSASVALLLGDHLIGQYPSLSPPELYRQVLQVEGV